MLKLYGFRTSDAAASDLPNTTALERAIAVACAELVNVPVPLRDLWNADRCPVSLLPFRLIGIGVEGVFELLRAIVMLPARSHLTPMAPMPTRWRGYSKNAT